MTLLSESKGNDLKIYDYGNQVNAITDSPLKSPSSLASSPVQTISTSTSRTIDDVWNDISLSSLHHRADNPSPFHDFLSPSSTTNPCSGFKPPLAAAAAAGKVISLNSDPITKYIYKSSVSSSESCNCTEPNLNSVSSFNFKPPPNFNSPTPSSSVPMKRPDPEYCEKHKRLMKNRESAARSRARKQARTDELDLEVERLTKENAMLKKQLQLQKLLNTAPARAPKKCRLDRTLTAPF